MFLAVVICVVVMVTLVRSSVVGDVDLVWAICPVELSLVGSDVSASSAWLILVFRSGVISFAEGVDSSLSESVDEATELIGGWTAASLFGECVGPNCVG